MNGGVIGIAADRLLFATIVMLYGTVDVAVDVDIVCAVLGRKCNRAAKRVPGGVFYTRELASEGVWAI